MNKRRCVIVGGAEIKEYEAVKRYINDGDYMIYCDCGLLHENELAHEADLIVGDFDSHEVPQRQTEMIVLPCEKDDTDTMFAVREGLKRGFEDFLMIGVIGGTLDHTLANVSALMYIDSLGMSAVMVDDHSEMEVISKKTSHIDDKFEYFSVLALGCTARGVSIRNAKYTLDNAEIDIKYQYAVRNEPQNGKIASVEVSDGILLIIKIREQQEK